MSVYDINLNTRGWWYVTKDGVSVACFKNKADAEEWIDWQMYRVT